MKKFIVIVLCLLLVYFYYKDVYENYIGKGRVGGNDPFRRSTIYDCGEFLGERDCQKQKRKHENED